MSKTQKTKMELVSTEESPSFKKKRMKEVRMMVGKALSQNQRIDLMEWEGTDVPRVMVALQDEVMRARDRHSRATKHIAESKQAVNMVMPIAELTMKLQQQTIESLVIDLEAHGDVIEGLNAQNIELARRNEDLTTTVRVMNGG